MRGSRHAFQIRKFGVIQQWSGSLRFLRQKASLWPRAMLSLRLWRVRYLGNILQSFKSLILNIAIMFPHQINLKVMARVGAVEGFVA